jgi:hypothetical protein
MICAHAAMEAHGGHGGGRNPKTESATLKTYFCQVRFLWRCARSFLRRLCLLILALRLFFNEPIVCFDAILNE